MNQPGLNALFSVIQTLSESELKTARQYLQAFTKRKESEYAKSLRLFDFLRKKKDEKDHTIQIHDVLFIVYGTQKDSAFDRLVIRLRDKILESLCLQTNFERKDAYSPRSRLQLELKTKITYAKIILLRGLDDVAANILSYCIDSAKKNELYDELLLALEEQMRQAAIKNNRKTYEKLVQQFDNYDIIRKEVHLAERAYTNIISFDNHYVNGKYSKSIIFNELERLEKSVKITNSKIVEYFYLYLLIHYSQIEKNYKSAKQYFRQLLTLINTYSYICTNTQKGLILASYAENELYLLQPDAAKEIAKNALEVVKPKSYNEGAIRLLIASINIYNSDSIGCIEQIDNFRKISRITCGVFMLGRANYLNAAAAFISGNFSLSLSLLHQLNPIEDDSEGWNIGIRLLTIQTQLELENFDEAEKAINNLYHHTRRTSKLSPKILENERLTGIITLLNRLKANSFDFKKLYQEQKELIDELENDIDLGWQVNNPEIINFSKWVFCKAIKQPFRQSISDIKITRKAERKKTA